MMFTELADRLMRGPILVKIVVSMRGKVPATHVPPAFPNTTFLLFSLNTHHASSTCSCCAVAMERNEVNGGVKEEGGLGVKQDRPAGPWKHFVDVLRDRHSSLS
jgi:hypothetical protein